MSLSITELQSHKKEIEIDLQKMERKHAEIRTSHILHLLLSLITAGVWIIVWVLVANANINRKKKLEKLIDESKSALIDIDRMLIPKAVDKQKAQTDKKTIECPWCAEDILEKAKICKHCGREVTISKGA